MTQKPRFEPTSNGAVRPVFDAPARVTAPATIELPRRANEPVRLADETSGVAVSFALAGASASEIAVADGVALYPGAGPEGADLLHWTRPSGTEDFLYFEHEPARAEVRYTVELEHVAGLHLVEHTLELLDAGGAPRLRVARPYLVDAAGKRHEAALAIDGCAVDKSPMLPWGRPPMATGARTCTLTITWHSSGIEYPALLDPEWSTTGTMLAKRTRHAATALSPSDKLSWVLVTGGIGENGEPLSTAEVYDPSSRTFGIPIQMNAKRAGHTATALGLTGESAKVLVAGGFDQNGAPLASLELFDKTDGQFHAVPGATMAEGHYDHTATLLGEGKVLIAGGTSSFNIPTAKSYVYSHNGGQPKLISFSMSKGRSGHAAAPLPSPVPGPWKVLLTGGFTSSGTATATAELFTFDDQMQQGGFGNAGAMSVSRAKHTATALRDGRVLVAGGTTDGTEILDTVEFYIEQPGPGSSGGFTAGPHSLLTPRAHHSATLLHGGEVLFAGGIDSSASNGLATAELFSPLTGMFALESQFMAEGRFDHVAVLTRAGQNPNAGLGVLIAGGGNNPPLASAALYIRKLGDACADEEDCASGHCIDGVCCERVCGQCEACDTLQNSGTCTVISGDPRPQRTPCPGQDSCRATCDGHNPVSCGEIPAGRECGTRDCQGDGLTEHTCSDAGTCVVTTHDCRAYACDENEDVCKSSCHSDSDCAVNARCTLAEGECRIIKGPTCDGRNTLWVPGAESIDCSPLVCPAHGRACAKCKTFADCVEPNVCTLDGRCVPPPQAPVLSSCSASPAAQTRSRSWPAVLLLAAAYLWRAWRRPTASR